MACFLADPSVRIAAFLPFSRFTRMVLLPEPLSEPHRETGFPLRFDRFGRSNRAFRYLSIYLSVVVVLAGRSPVDNPVNWLLMRISRHHNHVGVCRTHGNRNVDRSDPYRQTATCPPFAATNPSGLPTACAQPGFLCSKNGQSIDELGASMWPTSASGLFFFIHQSLAILKNVVHSLWTSLLSCQVLMALASSSCPHPRFGGVYWKRIMDAEQCQPDSGHRE